MYQNGYQQYKAQSVATMTKGEMLLLLYDELLKRLTRAEIAIEDEDYEMLDQSITRSKEIVRYLDSTLDYSYAISRDLHRMYDFFSFEICRLQASRKREIIGELKPLVSELREAFAQAEKQTTV